MAAGRLAWLGLALAWLGLAWCTFDWSLCVVSWPQASHCSLRQPFVHNSSPLAFSDKALHRLVRVPTARCVSLTCSCAHHHISHVRTSNAPSCGPPPMDRSLSLIKLPMTKCNYTSSYGLKKHHCMPQPTAPPCEEGREQGGQARKKHA
jgi:hypothetical protein